MIRQNRKFTLLRFSVVLWVFIAAKASFAFQFGTVSMDNAPLMNRPSNSARVIARLPLGTRVSATDNPTSGYYKVRTPKGVGYLSQDMFQSELKETSSAGAARPPRLTIRGYGGLAMFTETGITNQLGTPAFNGGDFLGGEISYNFAPRWAIALRVDHIYNAVIASDQTSGANYQFNLTSTPIFLGVDFAIVNNYHFGIHLGAFVGWGSIDFKTTTTSLLSGGSPSGNLITDYSSTCFPMQARLDIDWNFIRNLGLFVGAGYQLMSGSSAQPTTLASSPYSGLYQNSGSTVSLALNITGIELAGGLKIMF